MHNKLGSANSIPAKKHLSALGQITILILLATIFFRLRVLEAVQYADDFENILALGTLAQHPIHEILVKSVDLSDIEFHKQLDLRIQAQFSKWLQQHNPSLDEAHRKVRQSITDWLAHSGLPVNDLALLSGKGLGDLYPFVLFDSSEPAFETTYRDEAAVTIDPPVALMLEEAKQLASPTKFVIAASLQDSQLPKLDFPISQDRFSPGYSLDSIVLSKDSEVLTTFRENTGVSQQDAGRQEFRVPVVTKTIENVDMLPLIVGPLYASRLDNIGTNEALYQHLSLTYGQLRLSQGKDVTTKLVFDNYQKVEMLGFGFSASIFWIFVFLAQSVCLVAAIIYLRRAVSEDDQTPHAFGLNFLIEHRVARIILWCVLPSLSMILAFPQQVWTSTTVGVYWVSVIVLILVGVFVYRLSLRPGQPEPLSRPPL